MTAEDRRTTDREFERVWRAIEAMREQIGDVVTAVSTHAAVCTEAEKTRSSDRSAMKAGLERLLKDADRRGWVRNLSRAAWGAAVTAGAGLAWFWDHVGPTILRALGKGAVVLLVLLAGVAMAHEDDPVLRELMNPVTGGSCCHERDCSLTDDWDQRAGVYLVRVAGEWREVPAEIVIRDRGPHPSGRAVLCVSPMGQTLCFLPGSQGV